VSARLRDELEEPVAYNIADLFEYAVDYFPQRLALACGDATLECLDKTRLRLGSPTPSRRRTIARLRSPG
jgi:hypothetical protein